MDNVTLDALVVDGVRFLESITNHYGPEKGMEVWETIANAVGTEVKGKIFFAMITGRRSGYVKFRSGTASNAVSVIKCIRSYTNSGLKEAKDHWDLSKHQTVTIEVDPGLHVAFEKDLRNLGCFIS